MTTVSREEGQVPLVTTHSNLFIPTLNPFTLEVGEFTLLINPLPETNCHIPVPVVGAVAEKFVVNWQIVWSSPALEELG